LFSYVYFNFHSFNFIFIAYLQRNGKSSACNVLKINDRPDRLISRLKLNGEDGVPRLILIRAPKGPQGKGFSVLARHPRIPGKINNIF